LETLGHPGEPKETYCRNKTERKHVFELLFGIKVLDPAMGSGHFLVEAARYIADTIIYFADRMILMNEAKMKK
jgi:type I restriction-modification system DNA methylase subunit